jgi:hypothetical protein
MIPRRLRGWVVLVTAATLLLSGCDGAPPGTPAGPGPQPDRAAFAPGQYRAGDLDKDVAALARWGIATYADERATEPMVEVSGTASPLRLLRSQVEVMGTEAAAGVGTLGADLDTVFSAATGTDLRMSALLAGYLGSGSSMATGLRSALATVDLEHPAQAVFPTVALVGFVRDMAAPTSGVPATDPTTTTTTTHAFGRRSPAGTATMIGFAKAAQPSGPCTATTGWIEQTLATLFDGLRIPAIDAENWPTVLKPLGWLANQLITVYDAIRQGAQYVVISGVRLLIEPIRSALAQIAVIAGVVQVALTSIHPLTSSWAGPGYPEFGVDGDQELRYETTVHVRSANPLVWPALLVDCAKAAGVTLPDPSLAGSKVRWEPSAAEPNVIRELPTSDYALVEEDGGGKATFRFATSQEPKEWKDRGRARSVRTFVGAVVERKNKQIKDAADAAVKAALDQLLGFLPGFLKQRATALVRDAIDPALQQLVIRSEYRTSKVFGVTRHNKPEETPTPTPTMITPAPPPPVPVWVYVDRPGIAGAVEPGRILQLVACDGIAGTWRGNLRTGGLYDDDGFEVPWTDLPVTPFRIGNGGIGTARSQASGQVYVPLPNQTVPLTYNLVITVNGKSMTVDGVPVQAPVTFRDIPIQPAPAGVCK